MALIDWQSDFSVGNETIDRQHKKWIELYNTFHRIMTDHSPHDAFELKLDALQLLHEYMLYHFRCEEMLMAEEGYPDLTRHWRLHKDFDYKLFAYIRRLETGQFVATDEVLDLFRQWVTNHIQREDREVHQYIRQRNTDLENVP